MTQGRTRSRDHHVPGPGAQLNGPGADPADDHEGRPGMERNDQPPKGGTPSPLRTHRILAEPATLERCAADYAAAADYRTRTGHRALIGRRAVRP